MQLHVRVFKSNTHLRLASFAGPPFSVLCLIGQQQKKEILEEQRNKEGSEEKGEPAC